MGSTLRPYARPAQAHSRQAVWPQTADRFRTGCGAPVRGRDTPPMLQPRVMVAEDDTELRALLVKGLRRHELDVTGVGTGAQLLAGTEAWRPDALVVDVGLPDADGR